jgi:hypothetical protein
MDTQEDGYKMEGIVEMDETFLAPPRQGGKRGRGTDKTVVLVSARRLLRDGGIYVG